MGPFPLSCPGAGIVLCKGVGEAARTRRSRDSSVKEGFPAPEQVSLLLYQGVIVPHGTDQVPPALCGVVGSGERGAGTPGLAYTHLSE